MELEQEIVEVFKHLFRSSKTPRLQLYAYAMIG